MSEDGWQHRIPPAMTSRLGATEAAEVRAAELAATEAADAALLRARLAEVEAHRVEALTGHSPAELAAAREAASDARDAAGWDVSAPLGSPAHPEVLIDGVSVSRPVLAGREARRSEADALLARSRELSSDAVVARARSLSRRRAIAELEARLDAERGPAAGSAPYRTVTRSTGASPPAPVLPLSSLARPELAARLPRDYSGDW